jgi:ferredoxin
VKKLTFSKSLICYLDRWVRCMTAYDDAVGLDVEIDRDLCMGSGHCVFEAPGAFALDDDSVSTVVDPAASPEDAVMAAARKCPTGAITVRRDGVTLT